MSSSVRGSGPRRGTRPRWRTRGITRVFDYGEQSPLGGPYLVMELVDGQPLSDIIEQHGRIDPYVVLDIVAQAARALDVAHRSGIVHRDIKPGNLLIMADGIDEDHRLRHRQGERMQDVNLTATGLVMGTALYVSPEQATGQPVTGSSDVYSLGVVAYECLAGDPPFVAEQPVAIAIMHKHEPRAAAAGRRAPARSPTWCTRCWPRSPRTARRRPGTSPAGPR